MKPTLNEFLGEYKAELEKSVTENPDEYMYGPEEVAGMAIKMGDAFLRGTANLNAPTLKRVLKRYGVKPTYKEFTPWIQSLTK